MPRKKKNGTATLAKTGSGFAALAVQDGGAALAEVMAANLGGEALSPFSLDQVGVGAAGATIFQLPTLEGSELKEEFDGVIVAHTQARAYWQSPDPVEGTPPDCYSTDGVEGRGDPGGHCTACPLAQFGSALGSDGEPRSGQACKLMRRMYVLRREDTLPLMVTAPPSSLKNIQKYLVRLTSRALPYWSVVTRFKQETAQSKGGIKFSRLVLSVAERLPEGDAKAMKEYGEAFRSALADTRPEVAEARA